MGAGGRMGGRPRAGAVWGGGRRQRLHTRAPCADQAAAPRDSRDSHAANAVPVGDYHLPHMVGYALDGTPRSTDERMLELLEPYSGHRGRVIRLLIAAGIGAPRFGPKKPLRNIKRS